MSEIIKLEDVREVIIHLRGQRVIMASDVASLYGIHTRRVNEAVKNNPDKFPDGFIIELTLEEKAEVVENFDHLRKLKFSSQTLKAFTERGLYMLATILKSPVATQTTLAIINTFAQVRELRREIKLMHENPEKNTQIKFISRFGDLLSEIITPELETAETESSMEVNFFIGKLKHTVKRTRKNEYQEKLKLIAERLMEMGYSEKEIYNIMK